MAVLGTVFARSEQAWFDTVTPALEPRRKSTDVPSSEARVQRFEAIFAAHHGFAWRTVRRLGVSDAALDDAVQEVFVIVARKLDDIEATMEKSFIFGTARRVASAVRRANKTRGEHLSDDVLHERAGNEPTPEEHLGMRRAQAMLLEILEAMEDDVREAFILFELEGLSKSEVATILDIPEGTAASRLRRGREQFQAHAERLRARLEGAERRARA